MYGRSMEVGRVSEERAGAGGTDQAKPCLKGAKTGRVSIMYAR